MLSLEKFSAAAGLPLGALILGVVPCARHRVLLSGYLLNLWRGPEAVRDLILADFFCATEMGALARAADLLLVLRKFLGEFPEAGIPASARCQSEAFPLSRDSRRV